MKTLINKTKSFVVIFLVSFLFVTLFNDHTVKFDKSPIDSRPIYVRACAITENGYIDRGGPIVPATALIKSYKTFSDMPIVLGHEKADPNKVIGRILSSKVLHNIELKKDYIEIIFSVFDKDAIEKIKSGKYYSLSVGFRILEQTGERRSLMEEEVMPTVIEFASVEVSFVAVPRDKDAKVQEWSYELSEVLE